MVIQPYLLFNGRTQAALEFYRHALGAEIDMVLLYKESPEPAPVSAEMANMVMHSSFRIGRNVLMASDGDYPAPPKFEGFMLSLRLADEEDARRKFTALSQGGEVQMPLAETFFSPCFGMVKDRFGVGWMVLVGPKEESFGEPTC